MNVQICAVGAFTKYKILARNTVIVFRGLLDKILTGSTGLNASVIICVVGFGCIWLPSYHDYRRTFGRVTSLCMSTYKKLVLIVYIFIIS